MLSKKQVIAQSTLIVTALILALTAFPANGEMYSYSDAWNDPGFNLLSFDASGVDVTYSLHQFALEDMMIDGQVMQNVYIPGVIIPNNPGAPNLPGSGRYIAVPEGARAVVEVVDFRTETIKDVEIAPAAPIPLENDDSPPVYLKDPKIYNKNAYFPAQPVRVSEPTEIRGVDVVILGITPFQYNPVTKELLVYRDLEIRVSFVGGNGHFGEDRLRNRFFEPILQGNLLNYDQLPPVSVKQAGLTDEDNVEYLIIVPDDPAFLAWADSIKQWRNQQGIITGITTISEIGGNNYNLIENYINNAYYNWDIPPVAVLLLSDYQSTGDHYGITAQSYNYGFYNCVSDNFYADVDGNHLPDIVFGRITAQNFNHLQQMVGKMLEYERTPPTDPGVYQNPVIAGGWQTERWFILCTEVCLGYLQNVQNKEPIREYAIYSGTPGSVWSTNSNTGIVVDYFGPNGLGYIPANPSYLNDWGGNATRINNDLNNGAFLLLHRDHGMETGWGEPSYTVSNLSGLRNTEYPFVFSINCLTGKYNWSGECFVEAFHRMQYGALGVIAASEVSYSFVNDTFVWGMWDSMWPDFDPGYGADPTGSNELRPAFASAYGKYYLNVSNWPSNPGNKECTYYLFHHHGDPFITIYSEVPQNLTVSHLPALMGGVSEFTVTANEGALIGLSVDNQVIGSAVSTGTPVTIPIEPQVPGTEMLVTVTAQNYYRYSQVVPVVPPEGPYVVFNSIEINDANSWMPNGQLDFGEDVLLTVGIENIGVELAPDVEVTISTDDIYTTIIDGFEVFGDVNAGSIVTIEDAFEIQVTEDIPDGHNIIFEMDAASGDSVWTSNFSVTAHAPELIFEELEIDDYAGNNNGQFDPGETVIFNVSIKNNGSTEAFNVESLLSTAEPLITIPNQTATVASISPGSISTVVYEDVYGDSTISMGTNVDFDLEFTADGNYYNMDGFNVVVGDERYQPSGPCGYGYLAYDMYDHQAVFYDWVEIAPAAGGSGTTVNLGDDAVAHINLPFDFQYYGSSYSEVTVCSNGFMNFGYHTSSAYINSSIPSGSTPNNIVAAFWDDLNPSQGGQVCYYYDASSHRFIVEWYQVPHFYNTGQYTFQIILQDPDYFATPTGDGNILVNYHSYDDPNSVTIGLENSNGTTGIQFLYNGTYDQFAMPLEYEFAIMYTTGLEMPDLTITLEPQGTPIVIPANGGTFDYDVTIENVGTNYATFTAWTTATLPNGSETGAILLRPGIGLAPGANIFRNLTQTVPDIAPAGSYYYNAFVGGYPNNIIAQDSFPFEKEDGIIDGSSIYDDWYIEGWDSDLLDAASNLPQEFFLSQNYPNPFNPVTTLHFGLPEAGDVKLEVFNILGRKVATLVNGKLEAGYHSIVWDASELSSGVYFCKLEAGGKTMIKKSILMK